VRRLARAKVNLYLHVQGRRPDGYHLLDSLVVFPEFGDTVELVAAERASLTVRGPLAHLLADVPAEDNLAWKAAQLLLHEADADQHFEIRVTKRIPPQAGLGGASADAAAVLHLINERLNLRIAPEELQGLALRLGADVPACIASVPLFFSGIGEGIEPAPALALSLVLAWPGAGLATPAIFSALRQSPLPLPAVRPAFAAGSNPVDVLRHQRNDLQPLAERLLPAIGDVLASLRTAAGCEFARMTGSGSACFGVFRSQSAARTAANRITSAHPSWWVEAVAA
jgi:4-diphosphocytidyl-2-C-methyl-D-erythritol kinase